MKFIICFFLLFSKHLYSQTEILVNAPKIMADQTVTVLNSDEIKKLNPQQINDVLKSVGGVDVAREGVGGQASVFLRGGESGHTLVLIDGIEANDPSDPTKRFNFSLIEITDVEKIEIIQGGRSVAYGSDAISGVINIITKKKIRGEGKKLTVHQELGSYLTSKTHIKFAQKLKQPISYQLSANHFQNDGISLAKNNATENDSFKRNSLNGQIQYDYNVHRVQAAYDLSYVKQDLDDGANLDDPNSIMKTTFSRQNIQYQGSFLDNLVIPQVTISRNDYVRDFSDPGNTSAEASSSSYTKGDATKLDWQLTSFEFLNNKLMAGGEVEKELVYIDASDNSFLTTKRNNTHALFILDEFKFDQWKANMGMRHDESTFVTGATTYRFGVNYLFNKYLEANSSYGTGFKSPTIYQYYAPIYGNNLLKPEKSESLDVGISSKYEDKLTTSLSYFQTSYNDLIQFNSIRNKYENLGLANVSGIEYSLKNFWSKDFSTQFNYTYLKTLDRIVQKELPARAKEKASLNLLYQLDEKTEIGSEFLMMGRRKNSSSSDLYNAGYTLLNIKGSYVIEKNLMALARIENLFDKNYVEYFGYNTYGLSLFAGIKWELD